MKNRILLIATLTLSAMCARGSTVTELPDGYVAQMFGQGDFSLTTADGGVLRLSAGTLDEPQDLSVRFAITTNWRGYILIPGSTEHPFMQYSTGWAQVGNIYSQWFDVTMNPAPGIMGTLTLFDGLAGQVIATASINSRLTVVDEQQMFFPDGRLASGTGALRVTPNPEPATWIAGVALIAIIGARKYLTPHGRRTHT